MAPIWDLWHRVHTSGPSGHIVPGHHEGIIAFSTVKKRWGQESIYGFYTTLLFRSCLLLAWALAGKPLFIYGSIIQVTLI